MCFLRQVEGVLAHKLGVDKCQKEGVERVLQGKGEKPLRGYIERRHVMVVEWIALQPVFKVCAK